MPLPKHKELKTVKDYYTTKEDERCELINGEIVMQASPSTRHQEISGDIFTDIKLYIRQNGGDCQVYSAPFDVELDEHNVFVPDISVICDKDKIDEKGCKGAPDWIVEIISPSTASIDYIYKLQCYAAAGVKEYWIVDPRKETVFVYCFSGDELSPSTYTFREPIPVGIYDSNLKITIV